VSDLFTGIAPAIRGMLGKGAPEVTLTSDYFSEDGRCRFSLLYVWGDATKLVVIGQNPSKASRRRTDATVIRCARRAHRMGLGGLLMLNLFPFVATDPADLWAAGPLAEQEDVNLAEIEALLSVNRGATVIFAPGGDRHPRHAAMASRVEALARSLGVALSCLETTATGLPRHPSRLGYDAQVVPWTGSFARERAA